MKSDDTRVQVETVGRNFLVRLTFVEQEVKEGAIIHVNIREAAAGQLSTDSDLYQDGQHRADEWRKTRQPRTTAMGDMMLDCLECLELGGEGLRLWVQV